MGKVRLKNSKMIMSTSNPTPLYEEETYTVEYIEYPTGDDAEEDVPNQIICVITVIISVVGLVGNGKVVWFLGFRLKRNPFTSYMLNLAIADLGLLVNCAAISISSFICDDCEFVVTLQTLLSDLFLFTYSESLYLLTFISLERAFSVLFPIGHCFYRPERSSRILSGFFWVLDCLFSGMNILFYHVWTDESSIVMMINICSVNILIFTPLMVGSTMILFIGVYSRPTSHQPARMYTAILIALLCFIIFAIPYSIIFLSMDMDESFQSRFALPICALFASVNSTAKPIIYYLVGVDRKCRSRNSLELALQRVFRDEANPREGS